MNLAPSFAPSLADARPLAQHCSELTSRGPNPEERSANIAMWCRELGYDLSEALGQLFPAGKLKVTVPEPEITIGLEVFEKIGPVAANCLIRCGTDDQIMLLSLDFATAIAMTDSSFGGDGGLPSEPPEQLPQSAGLLIEACAGEMARAIAQSSGAFAAASCDVLVRSESATRLKPFALDDAVLLFNIEIALQQAGEWCLLLAATNDCINVLLSAEDRGSAGADPQGAIGNAHSGAFAQMPLTLKAVLGELDMTLEQLEALQPGIELPLPLPRNVPLQTGTKTIGHGALGTVDNQLAIKLTRLSDQNSRSGPEAAFSEALGTREPRIAAPPTRTRTDQESPQDATNRQGVNP